MIYPIGIQDFEKLRERGFVYVDKTAHIYKLAATGNCYFLSRPRRFGKSLLISTMEAYFTGKKELFKGLAMEQLEKEWITYPVLHLDLNTGKYDTDENLLAILHQQVTLWEKTYGTDESETTLAGRFQGAIRRACEKTGQKVVVLVDEYDKPMLQAIGNNALQESFRTELKAFYSVLKTQDRYIRFAFLTGVTKFSRLSVFSDLNNLEDISMDGRYADICGMTEQEIHTYFTESVQQLAEANKLSYEETLNRLKEQYDGYHFEYDTVGIYNPFSLLRTFKELKFKDYWFETGTPSFLVKLLKTSDYDLNNLQKEEISADILGSIDTVNRNPIPVIYQSGYLTIKGYDEEFKLYKLGFPNKEVENGFTQYLLPYYIQMENNPQSFVYRFVKQVREGNPEEFLTSLQTLFEDNSYEVQGKMELYFQNVIFIIFKIMGFYTEVEHRTARGRIDVVVKTADYIYVIELKLDGSADQALQQIEEKGYAKPFAQDGRKVYKIGINFSSVLKGIAEWKIGL